MKAFKALFLTLFILNKAFAIDCNKVPEKLNSALLSEYKNFFFTPSMYYVAQDIALGMIKILEETNLQKRNELYYELIYQESCLHDLDDSHDKIFEKVFNLKINKNSRVIQDHNIRFDDYVTYFSKYLYFLKYYNGQPFDLKYKLNYEGTCRGDFFKRYKACGNNKAEDTRAMKEFRDSIGYNSSSINRTKKFSSIIKKII